MNGAIMRLRYTQFFLICLLGVSMYSIYLSLPGGISQFETKFWHRETLISYFTQVKLTLGDRVFSRGVIGKQGWLEYTGDRNLDGYQNTTIISPQTLKKTQQMLNSLYKELRQKNITLLFVIPPNKATIYPDKLPNEIQKINQKSNLDTFIAYLNQHGPHAVVLDLRPALLNGRKKQDVYYKTDTHWNEYGAFIAYTEMMKELSKTYPQLAAKNINDFNIKIGQPQLQDITKIIGATNLFEQAANFIPKKMMSPGAPI